MRSTLRPWKPFERADSRAARFTGHYTRNPARTGLFPCMNATDSCALQWVLKTAFTPAAGRRGQGCCKDQEDEQEDGLSIGKAKALAITLTLLGMDICTASYLLTFVLVGM